MLHSLRRFRFRAGVLSTIVLTALAGCGPAPASPDVTVFRWVQAFAAQDGTSVARLTCRANQSDMQNARLLTMALGVAPPNFGGAGGGGQFFGGGGGGQLVYDVSQLRYETTFADSQTARVQMTGFLRLTSGMATQALAMNTTVDLVREEDQWRVCDEPAAASTTAA
jgi:hypothetical protein